MQFLDAQAIRERRPWPMVIAALDEALRAVEDLAVAQAAVRIDGEPRFDRSAG